MNATSFQYVDDTAKLLDSESDGRSVTIDLDAEVTTFDASHMAGEDDEAQYAVLHKELDDGELLEVWFRIEEARSAADTAIAVAAGRSPLFESSIEAIKPPCRRGKKTADARQLTLF